MVTRNITSLSCAQSSLSPARWHSGFCGIVCWEESGRTKWISAGDQLLPDSFQKMEHKLSISQTPFVQIIGLIDKIILEAYFGRSFIIFKVTSRTFIFSGFLGEKLSFFCCCHIFFISAWREFTLIDCKATYEFDMAIQSINSDPLFQNNLGFRCGIYFFVFIK